MQLLVLTLSEILIINPKAQIFLAATIRNETTLKSFIDECRKSSQSAFKNVPNDCHAENKNLGIEYLDFDTAPLDAQLGFFHSKSVPIQLLKITDLGPCGPG
jgi:hypothetical protein